MRTSKCLFFSIFLCTVALGYAQADRVREHILEGFTYDPSSRDRGEVVVLPPMQVTAKPAHPERDIGLDLERLFADAKLHLGGPAMDKIQSVQSFDHTPLLGSANLDPSIAKRFHDGYEFKAGEFVGTLYFKSSVIVWNRKRDPDQKLIFGSHHGAASWYSIDY